MSNVTRLDGRDIWQLELDIGLIWTVDDSGNYVATPGAYKLDIDSLTFF